jgi:hypothetical protein
MLMPATPPLETPDFFTGVWEGKEGVEALWDELEVVVAVEAIEAVEGVDVPGEEVMGDESVAVCEVVTVGAGPEAGKAETG